ncbi:hypothetical protein PORY_001677 [Pneumocystis oryctolagi]|uniref:Uncharacterized protein n=1 Tax=Pneumocystis oryctolagi TaxID=42067 RepID=A0ACB7CD57_9ASCO|nr:hypothetical protein PORY_001677 [Pneumocystis oryctolagi]
MVKSTVIARITDGLPLCASVDDKHSEIELQEQKQQSKIIFGKLTENSEIRATIESGQYFLHYFIDNNVCYLCICDKSYPRKLAFSYLDEISKEFWKTYGSDVMKLSLRPYAFSSNFEIDIFIQKTTRLYLAPRASSNLDKLNNELQDVTRAMTKNIEDLIYRGHSLDRMSNLSSDLRSESIKYKKVAKKINFDAFMRQYRTICMIIFIVILIIWWRFF